MPHHINVSLLSVPGVRLKRLNAINSLFGGTSVQLLNQTHSLINVTKLGKFSTSILSDSEQRQVSNVRFPFAQGQICIAFGVEYQNNKNNFVHHLTKLAWEIQGFYPIVYIYYIICLWMSVNFCSSVLHRQFPMYFKDWGLNYVYFN